MITAQDLVRGTTDEPMVMAAALSLCIYNPPCEQCLRIAIQAAVHGGSMKAPDKHGEASGLLTLPETDESRLPTVRTRSHNRIVWTRSMRVFGTTVVWLFIAALTAKLIFGL